MGPGEPSPTPSPDPCPAHRRLTDDRLSQTVRPRSIAGVDAGRDAGRAEPVVLAVDGDALVVGGYRLRELTIVEPCAPRPARLVARRSCRSGSRRTRRRPTRRWRDGTRSCRATGSSRRSGRGRRERTRTRAGRRGPARSPLPPRYKGRERRLRRSGLAVLAFGGYGAEELLDAVATSSGRFLVGSWKFDRPRCGDLARGGGAGSGSVGASALASTPTALVGAVAATSTGSGILIVGAVTHLGDLSIGVRRSRGGVALKAGRRAGVASTYRTRDRAAKARSAECAPDGCVVAGAVEGRCALWWLPTTTRRARLTTPEAAVAERDAVPAPIRSAAERVWPRAGSRRRRGPGRRRARRRSVAARPRPRAAYAPPQPSATPSTSSPTRPIPTPQPARLPTPPPTPRATAPIVGRAAHRPLWRGTMAGP